MPMTTERDPFDRLTPGTQALVLTPSLRSPLSTLPPAAFENLLVVSTTRPPVKVEQFVRDRGGDPNKVGVVPVSGSPVDYDGALWTTSVVHPNDLTGIHDRFERALVHVKPGTGWVVFDNVNVLLMYAERSAVGQLVDSVAARTRERAARGVFALVRDAVTDSTYERFGGGMDLEVDYRGH
ncbi:DUF7504 family protein [Haloarchaeobius iranensis]|uniref:DUF835 domain-containing protein n=2 Tax=Haloarchaeobius iranensis TaxID=996166 RepID=A0A1G9W6G2_9EURY|nr:hypothetical protein [Haloarchaeobius iranensis]SDM80134.1 hypothetical protein SAMN05192554_107185 [Haloarchaeobius iranensis]